MAMSFPNKSSALSTITSGEAASSSSASFSKSTPSSVVVAFSANPAASPATDEERAARGATESPLLLGPTPRINRNSGLLRPAIIAEASAGLPDPIRAPAMASRRRRYRSKIPERFSGNLIFRSTEKYHKWVEDVGCPTPELVRHGGLGWREGTRNRSSHRRHGGGTDCFHAPSSLFFASSARPTVPSPPLLCSLLPPTCPRIPGDKKNGRGANLKPGKFVEPGRNIFHLIQGQLYRVGSGTSSSRRRTGLSSHTSSSHSIIANGNPTSTINYLY